MVSLNEVTLIASFIIILILLLLLLIIITRLLWEWLIEKEEEDKGLIKNVKMHGEGK